MLEVGLFGKVRELFKNPEWFKSKPADAFKRPQAAKQAATGRASRKNVATLKSIPDAF
jgi:hypothetical protein